VRHARPPRPQRLARGRGPERRGRRHDGARWGLVVGYGSVGRHHAPVLTDRCGRLAVVDLDEGARAAARADHDGAVVHRSLDGLDDQDWNWAEARAVVATWGPSHATLVDELLERGSGTW
jgi:predicted dehydrogenase